MTPAAQNIQIEGVYLNEASIRQLITFQDDNNDELEYNRESIADLTFFLINHKEMLGNSNANDIDKHLRFLGHLRNQLFNLRRCE